MDDITLLQRLQGCCFPAGWGWTSSGQGGQQRPQETKVLCSPWPAHSPDLSPIENLWADLKKRLEAKHGVIPKVKLWEVVDEEWEKTRKELCRNLFASMPDRLQAVIKAKGGYTKY